MTRAFIRPVGGRRFNPFIAAIVAATVVGLSTPVSAQTTGPQTFDETETALTGTYACNGGTTTSIAPVDASTTDGSGSNQNNASNLSASACGMPLYSIGTASDATEASDTPSADGASGSSNLQEVSLLGGVVTYDTKTETDTIAIDAVGADTTSTIILTNHVRLVGKVLDAATYTQATTFPINDVQVALPGVCTGAALFNGTLTLAGSSTQGLGTSEVTHTETPIELKGTMTCVGLPLTSMTVDIADQSQTEIISNIAGGVFGLTSSRALRVEDTP